jgi:hypothetical protein
MPEMDAQKWQDDSSYEAWKRQYHQGDIYAYLAEMMTRHVFTALTFGTTAVPNGDPDPVMGESATRAMLVRIMGEDYVAYLEGE